MITLTKPNGHKIEIDPDHITIEEDAEPGMFDPAAKAVIRIDGEMHAVKETVAQIDALKAGVKK